MTEKEYNERAAWIMANKNQIKTELGLKIDELLVLPFWIETDFAIKCKISNFLLTYTIDGKFYNDGRTSTSDLIIPPMPQPETPKEHNQTVVAAENATKAFLELAAVAQNLLDTIKAYEPPVDTFGIIQKWRDRYPDGDLLIRFDDGYLITFWPKSSYQSDQICVFKNTERDAVLEFDRFMNKYRNK